MESDLILTFRLAKLADLEIKYPMNFIGLGLLSYQDISIDNMKEIFPVSIGDSIKLQFDISSNTSSMLALVPPKIPIRKRASSANTSSSQLGTILLQRSAMVIYYWNPCDN